jgi:hypothetical protein
MDKGLHTEQIDHILRTDPRTKQSYNGTFACDLLKNIEINKFPISYVINSDESSEPGTHWLSVYLKSKDSAHFFDSYAMDLSRYKDIEQFIYRVCDKKVTVNQLEGTPLQSDSTDVCGHWCIIFLRLLGDGLGFNDFLNIFKDSKKAGFYDDFIKAFTIEEYNCKVKQCKVKRKTQKCKCKYDACCSI